MAQRERTAGKDEVTARSRLVTSIPEAPRTDVMSTVVSLDVGAVPARTGQERKIRAVEQVEAAAAAAVGPPFSAAVGPPFSSLRRAREAHGLTLEQAAASAQIRPHYLEIIEAGQLDKLPGLTYARNMVERYAIFLGLDAENVLEEAYLPSFFERETLRVSQRMAAKAKGSPLWVSPGAPPPKMRRRRLLGFISAAAAVAAVIAALLLGLL